MAKNESPLQASSIKALNAFVSIIWIFGIITLIAVGVMIPIMLLASPPSKENWILFAGGLYLSSLILEGISLWIINHLKNLVETVEQGSPFDKKNPGRIRCIAYGVFAWVPVKIFYKLMHEGYFGSINNGNIMDLLWRPLFNDFTTAIFIGIVILVIARVFEIGVRLQQDQSLTI